MSKFQKTMKIIASIFLHFLGIFLIGFHKQLEINSIEAGLFFLIFIELGNFKQLQLEVKENENH